MAKLIFTDPKLSGRIYELNIETTSVGRGEQNTLVIHDSTVSARHCEILVNGNEVIVRDLDSHNGTFVDGVRLNKQSQAKSGQTVRFGSVEARLELDLASDDTDASSMTAIHSHAKAVRDQRRAQEKPAPKNPAMHLDAGSPSGQDEPTVMFRQTDLPQRKPVAPVQQSPESQPAACAKGKYVIMAAAVALALVALLWLAWGRK